MLNVVVGNVVRLNRVWQWQERVWGSKSLGRGERETPPNVPFLRAEFEGESHHALVSLLFYIIPRTARPCQERLFPFHYAV